MLHPDLIFERHIFVNKLVNTTLHYFKCIFMLMKVISCEQSLLWKRGGLRGFFLHLYGRLIAQ